jgi:hypothetical protein
MATEVELPQPNKGANQPRLNVFVRGWRAYETGLGSFGERAGRMSNLPLTISLPQVFVPSYLGPSATAATAAYHSA